jgi:hypothetical protein
MTIDNKTMFPEEGAKILHTPGIYEILIHWGCPQKNRGLGASCTDVDEKTAKTIFDMIVSANEKSDEAVIEVNNDGIKNGNFRPFLTSMELANKINDFAMSNCISKNLSAIASDRFMHILRKENYSMKLVDDDGTTEFDTYTLKGIKYPESEFKQMCIGTQERLQEDSAIYLAELFARKAINEKKTGCGPTTHALPLEIKIVGGKNHQLECSARFNKE